MTREESERAVAERLADSYYETKGVTLEERPDGEHWLRTAREALAMCERVGRSVASNCHYAATVKSHSCFREDDCDTTRSHPLQELADDFARLAHYQEPIDLTPALEEKP